MKRISLIFCIFLCLIAAYCYFSSFIKRKTTVTLKNEIGKITAYTQWGYDASSFEKMHEDLIKEADSIPFLTFPFRTQYIQNKQDNIMRLIQTGYAIEVTKQKELVQSRLIYLRDRIKNETVLDQERKKVFSDTFEVVAGEVFEKNSDITGLKKALATLDENDHVITQEVDAIRKESLIHELENYKATCQELLIYFSEKNDTKNLELATQCISAADKLMSPAYNQNGVDFIETLSRERVYTLVQQATQAKQQIIQNEQYAQAEKKKKEERLAVVPPSPLQEGKVIVVNIALQRLYAYENGTSLFPAAVPITTGKYGFETVTGEFAIYLKEEHHQMTSPFPGIYYDDIVNYWMPFYLGYGLHDAPWRSVYGTQDYSSVGSHGCVNMPLSETSILYNWAEVGTRVIVM